MWLLDADCGSGVIPGGTWKEALPTMPLRDRGTGSKLLFDKKLYLIDLEEFPTDGPPSEVSSVFGKMSVPAKEPAVSSVCEFLENKEKSYPFLHLKF
jgi:hypothetical protein